jgi:hypothetical protein
VSAFPAGRTAAAAALLALAVSAAPARAGEVPIGDADNGRNVKFTGPVIEWVGAFPRAAPLEPGEASAWPAGEAVEYYAAMRVLGGGGSGREPPRWTIDGVSRGALPLTTPRGAAHGIRWKADGKRHVVRVEWGGDVLVTTTDALRVLVLVERAELAAGDGRFGSFARRFRKSLDDLHALLDASVWPLAPKGVSERFRLDDVRPFDKGGGALMDLVAHPGFDVVVVSGDPERLVGWDRKSGAIGHATPWPTTEGVAVRAAGIWSSAVEHALWRDLLRSRGVPDYALWAVPAGALPGRTPEAIPLPERFAKDLAATPRGRPVVGELSAVLLNARRGVAVVGDPEDPGDRDGHVWNRLPARIDLALTRGGSALAGATVRWWRSKTQEGLLDGRTPGVAAGRAPDGEAVADAAGKASISGDFLGRSAPKGERSRWLLVEVESSGERRFEVVLGLDLNLAYARGHKHFLARSLRFEDLRPSGS